MKLEKRRTFLKQVLVGTTTLWLPISCSQKATTTSTIAKKSKSKIGVALLGLGSYSTYQLAPALQKTKHCYLAGIVTGSPHKIPEWQKKYSIPDANTYSYDNLSTIANNDDIDVVYIVTPTGTHAKFAIQAANAGKHVWCEKPMAMKVEECQAIIDACKKNKVELTIGYRMQHETNTKELISYTTSKPFGAMTKIEAAACYSGGEPRGWRASKAMGGGALYDMGVYTVNGIRYASQQQPVKVISAKQYTNRPALFKEVDETTEYQLELANGLIAHGKTSVGAPENFLKVTCESGHYQLSPMQSYNGVVGNRSDGVQLDAFVDSQQALQMDDDALALLEKRPMMIKGEEGMEDIRIIQAIIKSAEMGSSVSL